MPSRQVGNLAVAVAFALFAVFLYFARDEHGAWRSDYRCLFSKEHPCSTAISSIDSKVDISEPPQAAPSEPAAPPSKKQKAEPAAPPSKKQKAEPAAPPSKKKKAEPAAPTKKTEESGTPLSKEVKDPATGLKLPRTKRFSKADLTCLGVGVRYKSLGIAHVNVYTVGLYVDPKGARGSLKQYAGADPRALSRDGAVFKTLGQAGGFTKYLHLVFARSVAAHKVVDALTSVEGVREKVLAKFSTMMLDAVGKNIGKKESISLGWEGKDKLVVVVRDKVAGTVVDSALPKAIFDLYLGSSPVSSFAKTAFAEGVPAFLAS